jgi:hypothetical protein
VASSTACIAVRAEFAAAVVDRGRHGPEDRNDGEREDQRDVAGAVGAKRARRGLRPRTQAARERDTVQEAGGKSRHGAGKSGGTPAACLRAFT